MNVLLDASALLNVVRALGPDALDYIRECYILTFTQYEIGNAIREEAVLLKRLSIDKALTLMNLILLIYRYLNVVNPYNIVAALKLAYELKITYYDASYVTVASEHNVSLVTDDAKLRKKIELNKDLIVQILGKKVKALSSNEYIAMKNV